MTSRKYGRVSCQMDQLMVCNEDGTVRKWSIWRFRLVRRTIFSAKLGATRSRFAFWVRMKWCILRVWLWKDMVRKRIYEWILQAHLHKGTTWHISMLLTKMITTAPSVWRPSGKSITTLESFFLALDPVVHSLFVAVCYLAKLVIGKSEWNKYFNRKMTTMTFKLILLFIWSTLQLCSNGMASQNVQVGCVNQSLCLVIVECVIFD